MNKPTNLNRRQFLKRTGIVLGGGIVAASVPIIYQANTPRDIGPAYRYWEQKQKGGLTDQEYIVMCATLAANPHNTQPWKFKIASDRIELFADRERNLGAADATRRMMQMGIGCAIENMHVAAKKLGYRLTIKDMDADQRFSTDGHCATLQLEKGTPGMHPWFEPLFRRQTVRSIYDTAAPPKRLIDTLAAQADLPGLKLIVQRSSPQLEAINNLNREAVRLFVADNKQYRAAMQWFRISRDEWIEKRDGIAIYTSTAPYLIKQAINYTVSPEDLYLDDFKQGEIDSVDTVAPATPLWGLLVGERASPNIRINGGRILERIYLEATRLHYAVHPLSYATEMPVAAARLKKQFGLAPENEPLLLFRIGRAPLQERSVRRELSDVLIG